MTISMFAYRVQWTAVALLIAAAMLFAQSHSAAADDLSQRQSGAESCAPVKASFSNFDLFKIIEDQATSDVPHTLAAGGCPPGYRNSLGYCIPLNATSCGGGRYCSNGGHCCGNGCCDMQSTCIIQNGVYGCRRL